MSVTIKVVDFYTIHTYYKTKLLTMKNKCIPMKNKSNHSLWAVEDCCNVEIFRCARLIMRVNEKR